MLRRRPLAPAPVRFLALILALPLPCPVAEAQVDTLWRYSSATDVVWMRPQRYEPLLLLNAGHEITALNTKSGTVSWHAAYPGDLRFVSDPQSGPLYIVSGTSIQALEAETGREVWNRHDLPDMSRAYIALPWRNQPLLVQDSTGLQALGPFTGLTLWDSRAITGALRLREFITMRASHMILLFAETPDGPSTIFGVDIDSGTVRWQRNDLFSRKLSYRGGKGASELKDYQFVSIGDSAFVLYATPDGPMRINAASGRTEWVGTGLGGLKVASLEDGYVPMCVCMGHLLVPYREGLAALDPGTGTVRWKTPLPDRPTSVHPVATGVLVSGLLLTASFTVVLDSASGEAHWPPFMLGPDDRMLWGRDTVVVTHDDRVMAIPLATGKVDTLARVNFKWGEKPKRVQGRRGGGYVLMGRENLQGIAADGSILYNRYYRSPGPSFGEQMLSSWTRRKGYAQATDQVYYALAEAPDGEGGKYFAIVATNMEDGAELRRVIVNARDPDYDIDLDTGHLYLRKKRDITALNLHIPFTLLPQPEPPAADAPDAAPVSDS